MTVSGRNVYKIVYLIILLFILESIYQPCSQIQDSLKTPKASPEATLIWQTNYDSENRVRELIDGQSAIKYGLQQ